MRIVTVSGRSTVSGGAGRPAAAVGEQKRRFHNQEGDDDNRCKDNSCTVHRLPYSQSDGKEEDVPLVSVSKGTCLITKPGVRCSSV